MKTITYQEILADLDLDKIEHEILTDPDRPDADILQFEFSEAKALMLAACEKWLVSDLRYIDPVSLEIETPFTVSYGSTPVRGIIDIGARFNSQHWNAAYRDKRFVVDWKSASGELDTTWKDRHVASKQWRLYASATEAELFSYRGISRSGKTREILIEVPAKNNDIVNRYFSQVGGMVTGLMASGADTWPQHRPSACGQYGTICPFSDDCTFDKAPRYPLESANLILSYSSSERFLTCPEKYRRLAASENRGLDGSESTRIGGAMHRGLAETYRQAFMKFGGTL